MFGSNSLVLLAVIAFMMNATAKTRKWLGIIFLSLGSLFVLFDMFLYLAVAGVVPEYILDFIFGIITGEE